MKKGSIEERRERRRDRIKQQIKDNKGLFIVYLVLRIVVVAVMIAQLLNGHYENVFLCVLTLILFVLPAFVERNFRIDVPDTLEIIILLFIFCAEILGEIQAYYIAYPFWDTMLHTTNGFLAAAIGFSMVDILNRNKRFSFSMSPLFMAITAFCFSMTIGVLWEFFEFGADYFFHTDMQKDTVLNAIYTVTFDPTNSNQVIPVEDITAIYIASGKENLWFAGYLDIGLYDTMKDLFVNFIGAIVFSVIGFFYIKNRGAKAAKFAERFIPQPLESLSDNPPGENAENLQ